MGTVHVAAVQFSPVADAAANRATLTRLCDDARGATLIVAPEYSAWYSADPAEWQVGAETLDGEFVRFLTAQAAHRDAMIIAGLIERDGDALFNAVVAVDATGVRGHYRKVHLYDAFGATESRWLSAGKPEQPSATVEWRGLVLGLMTCYDLRFPEIARMRSDAGAHVLVVPSDWVPGDRKRDHWRTLTAARAVENLCWVVAADHAAPSGIGYSRIIDPQGDVVEAADSEAVLIVDVSVESVTAARAVNPALTLRRYGVVPR
ncbi:putative amidohydrolase [Microbacteriaceae bacterium MWH-Ta3]|nr:putative amidohydrolase [Microbacteriaceae bacterium MWH-Ta3]